MKPASVAAACVSLLVLGVLSGREGGEEVCRHGRRGRIRRVSLDRVRAAQEDVKRKLAWTLGRIGTVRVGGRFDAGLPACGRRRRRVLRTPMPRALVGKRIAFARLDRMPEADFRVATSARTLDLARVDALADAAVTRRLGVRCAPTTVRVLSEVEIEVVENP